MRRGPYFSLAAWIFAATWSAPLAAGQEDAGPEKIYLAAEEAFQQERYAEAEAGFAELIRLLPDSAEARAKLGLVYYVQRKCEPALSLFQQALKIGPDLPNVAVFSAICLAEMGRFSEALPGLRAGFEEAPDAATRRVVGLELMRAYAGSDRRVDASRMASLLIERHGDDPEVLYHAGRLLADLATESMRRLFTVSPESSWSRRAAGEAFESRGDLSAAVSEYRAALALEPQGLGLNLRLGRLLSVGGSDEEALRHFKEEFRLDPSNAAAAYEIGESHRKHGRTTEAKRYFETALRLRPDLTQASIAIGRILRREGRTDAAIRRLEDAVQSDPNSEAARYHLALAYRDGGDEQAHRLQLREFERLRASRTPRTGLARLEAGIQPTPQSIDDVAGEALDVQ